MSDYKFKAWDKVDNKMRAIREINFNQSGDLMSVVLTIPFPTNDGDVDFEFVKRKPEEVELLRYTGMKDVRGKEIYQEDIIRKDYYNGFCYLRVRYYNYFTTIVEFLPNLPHEYVIGLRDNGDFDYYYLFELENYDLTVVGNTKEDSELLGNKVEQLKFIDKVLDIKEEKDE